MQLEKWKGRYQTIIIVRCSITLAVTEYDFADLKAQQKRMAWELQITVKHYFIERKEVEEDIRYLVEAEQRFWTCVVEGHRPVCSPDDIKAEEERMELKIYNPQADI